MMTRNDDLFAARAARDEAMERVEEAAPDEWKARAWKVLKRVAATHATFTTDDLVELGAGSPPEPRAYGPLMRAAVKAGLCEATGQYRKSRMVACHARPKAVYRAVPLEADGWEPLSRMEREE